MLLAKHYFSAILMAFALVLGISHAHAQKVDRKQPPAEFIDEIATQALDAVKNDTAAQGGDRAAINALVNQYVLPYVNFEKTTRLATGRHWRQASPEQRNALVDSFKNTLIRTYSGALANVNKLSSIQVGPFRGDANAEDVVVRTTIIQRDGPAVGVDYRMEQTPDGWLIYDLNVEGIWLIQNYRNQFSEVIQRDGIDGLIDSLNKQTMPVQNP
ncbi:phospholipid-binding protein MlaC [Paenalcaligenes hominis]|uniref:MlaC/ttg2D family ABC transporter substrate-binding protein n=1 Tax=Paenalcaligenes hominis TaxID=643674 RepID=UPI0035247F6E